MNRDSALAQAFAAHFGRDCAGRVRAPGRVNLIGEHTDYNDGFVLPMAITRETRIAWAPRDDGALRVLACDFANETDAFALDADPLPAPGGWRDYVRGMVMAMRERGFALGGGADLAITGDIPKGAGLSSSASLEIALGHALLGAAGAPGVDPARLAQAAQYAENAFVGVRCGIMDQLASAASVAGHALMIDCRSFATRAVPLPPDVAVLIIDSGIARGLVEGEYNRRRAECEAAARVIGVAALRDADMAMLARAAGAMPATVHARARHVIGENARVLAAAEALAANDLAALGTLMEASHASMRDDFAITLPAIDQLAALAHRAIGGEGGARMTGGGFGGAVVAVLRRDRVETVVRALREAHRTPAGAPPQILVEQASAGAGAC